MAAIGIGANLGDRLGAVRGAVASLGGITATRVTAVSDVYLTKPVGGPDQPDYLNAVALVETELGPAALLGELQRIELAAGRVRGVRFGARTLDLDILLFDDLVIHGPGLDVPHPRMAERRFVLEPLRELIDAGWVTAALEALDDDQQVRRLGPLADATIELSPDEG